MPTSSREAETATAAAARRRLWLLVASTGYVAAAALHAEGGVGLRPWALGGVAIALASFAARRSLSERGRAATLSVWGLSIVIASLGTDAPGSWVDALGIVGALVSALSACWAMTRMSAPEGLSPSRAPSPALASAGLVLVWASAFAVSVSAALELGFSLEPFAHTCAAAAGAASLLALIGSSANDLRSRALVLGVADRARTALGLASSVALLAAGVSLLGLGATDRVMRLGAAVASVMVMGVSLHGDAATIARVSRRTLMLLLVGGPVAVLGATIADGRPWDAPAIVLMASCAALAIGAAARRIEAPLRPEEGAWLDAIASAEAALHRGEPDVAVRDVLTALRAAAGPSAASPELWTLEPTRVLTIDAAGYPHEREADLPSTLIAIATSEPESTLRAEVLDALVVRRPDLRILAHWMDDRGAFAATVVVRQGESHGLLVLPRGKRAAPLSLEEARALKHLADSLAGACAGRAALARSQARETEATTRADAAEDRAARLEQARDIDAGRLALATARLARPATAGVYSAASRSAFEAIERRVLVGAPVALVAPSGVDPVPYLARAHLAGPRRSAPLVLVDGTSTRDHDLARWRDPLASPFALAGTGLLVLLDGAALPPEVQRLIAGSLAERRAPWERGEPLDVALAFTATLAPRELALASRLEPALAARLGDAADAPIVLPRLRERPEDLRAIVTDRLAREGLRTRGAPIGIDDAAFARLVQHPFDGEDAELRSIVQRLVAGATGHVIRASDVDDLGLGTDDGPRVNVRPGHASA